MADVQSRFPTLIDPDVPVVGAPPPTTQPSGTRVDFEAHLPPGVERVGRPETIDLSQELEIPTRLQDLDPDVEFVYVVRDNATGEILKVGETAQPAERARDYIKAARHAMGRSVSMEIQPVRIGTEAA